MRTRFSAVAAMSLVLAELFIFSRGVKSNTLALVPSSGIDNTLGTMKILSAADLSQMALSDNSRNGTAGNWLQSDTYDESKYIEFDFTPSLPSTASISSITITHQYYTQATLSAAKFEVWNGTSFQDVPISLPLKTGSSGEISETQDISMLNLLSSNIIKVRFLAYRSSSLSSVANLKTFHNYVAVSIMYTMPTPSATEDVLSSPTQSDTFTPDASGSAEITPSPVIEASETPFVQIQTPLPTPFPTFEPESDDIASESFEPVASISFKLPSPSPTASPSFTPTPEATPSASFTIASVSLMAVIAPPKIVHHAIKATPKPSIVPSAVPQPLSHVAQAKMSVIHIWRLLTRYLSMIKR